MYLQSNTGTEFWSNDFNDCSQENSIDFGWKHVSSKGKKPKSDEGKAHIDGTSYLKTLLRIGKTKEKVLPDKRNEFSPKDDKSNKMYS